MGRGPNTTSNGQIVPTSKTPNEKKLAQMITSMTSTSLKEALPKHLTAERMGRVALTALRKNAKLAACTPESFLGSLLTAAQLGLEVNTPLGEAYLIPFKGECQIIIGYQGYLKLARNSGLVSEIYAHAVRDGDEFSYELGLNQGLRHVPSTRPDREEQRITHCYAVAKLKDGGTLFKVLSRAQIDKRRARSTAPAGGPWDTDPEAMVEKTAVRALAKWIPRSAELVLAAAIDEAPELGRGQVEIMDDAITDALRGEGLGLAQPDVIDEEPEPSLPPTRTTAEPAPKPVASQPRSPSRRRSRREQAQEAAESQGGHTPGDPRTPEQIEQGWEWDQTANEIVPPVGWDDAEF